MPRPIKPRWIEYMPEVTYFKPAGVPLSTLSEVSLGIDELEAIRLKDSLGLEQEECAERMGVAQSTFQRILTTAREKIAGALIEGKAIKIEGGHYRFLGQGWECSSCGYRWTSSPKAEISENTGENVASQRCPRCGSADISTKTLRKQESKDPYEIHREDDKPLEQRPWGHGRGRRRGPRQ